MLTPLFLLVLMSGAVQPAQDVPPQADQQGEIERIVAYDDLQRDLIRWDLQLALKYKQRGEDDLAEEKALSAGKRRDDILDRYVAFLKEHPENAAAHNYYGEALADMKNAPMDAAEEWRKAIELDPKLADAHNNLGIHFSHYGQPGKALDEFRKAVELDANVGEFHFNLGLALHNFRYVAMSKYGLGLPEVFEQALKESRRARELEPKDLEIALDYARTFFGAEDFKAAPDWEEALAAWEFCLPLTDDADAKFNILLNQGRVALRMDRKGQAGRYFREALAIRPDSPVAKKLLETAR
jgi:Tfp pilus assembly protein PilF